MRGKDELDTWLFKIIYLFIYLFIYLNVICRILVSQAGTEHEPWQLMGFPRGISGKEPTSQWRRCKRRMFNPWVRKFPWRKRWQPTPVFSPGEPHEWTEEPARLQSIGLQRVGHDWSDLVRKHAWQLQCWVLVTGLPGNSLDFYFKVSVLFEKKWFYHISYNI